LDKLPTHLLDFVIDQPYNEYTAQDHAVWRYVMRQNVNFLGRVAHSSYLNGLKKTGISIDSIPHMYGMNRILKEIGWAAVAVDGFIPPQAFMEFQAYNVLVIAADIRNIEHIQYTPAPDIIHEAAGHAPIIADPEYALYLKRFGEIGSKAFSSKKDYELYEAIRHLSIIKENPNTEQQDIDEAEKHIDWLQNNMGEASEMAKIRNLHWWTVEYGLIGTVDDYKLYGAGLLSSIGESANCMKSKVKKIPYSIEACNYGFDITTEQPQLFVTPTFQYLNEVLDEFAEQMAFNRGGQYGLDLAIRSGALATLELDNGVELSGLFTSGKSDAVHNFFELKEDCGLFKHKQLLQLNREKQDTIFNVLQVTSNKDIPDLVKRRFNIEVEDLDQLNEQLFFAKKGNHTIYVLVTDSLKIKSAYPGPAEPEAWGLHFEPPKEKTMKIVYNEKAKKLHALYAELRKIREEAKNYERLKELFQEVDKNYPQDWLLSLEIYEILNKVNLYTELQHEILQKLETMKMASAEREKLISDGLDLIQQDVKLVH
ncbi:MAG: aromatic amino acid hydroxylase, partial [Luteibaculum sp.]